MEGSSISESPGVDLVGNCSLSGSLSNGSANTSPYEVLGAGEPPGDFRNEELAKLEVAVLAVTFAVAVLGNGCVLLALCRSPRKASRMHLFIRHLSLADLVVAFFQVLPQLCWKVTYRFQGPDGLCRVVKHLQVFGMFASAYMLVVMTADRYIAVCHPLQTLQRPAIHARLTVATVWALSLLLSTPQYCVFSLVEVDNATQTYDCWATFIQPWGPRAYVTWMAVSVFVVPVLILCTCYGFICYHMWRNVRSKTLAARVAQDAQAAQAAGPLHKGLLLVPCVSSIKIISRAKIRTVRMTFVIVAAYIGCWTPFFITQLWSVWDETFPWVESENPAVIITALLAALNSCCNPWIYMFFSGHLLQDCVQSLLCCLNVKQKFHKEDSDSVSQRHTSYTNNRSPTNGVVTWKHS